MTADPGGERDRPFLRVVRGDPTPEEVAALVAVLAARARVAAAAPGRDHNKPVGGWTDRRALLGAPLRPGPGAWRASLR